LNGIEVSNIIETWRIRRVGGLSHKDNIVVLLGDGTHLCTCLETVTKGIICQHFWKVMLYPNSAKFHINIIPNRWYKDSILTNLDINLKNSPVLTAIEASTDTSYQVTCTFQSLHYIQGIDNNEVVQKNTHNHQRNRFGIAFSTAKTAVNVALETNSDQELIQLLRNFIEAKREKHTGDDDGVKENYGIEVNQDSSIIPLQENLVEQITSPHVTKVRGAPSKRRLKSAMETSKRRVPMQEIADESNIQPAKQQRRCLLCGKFGHYQKKCPEAR